MFQLGMACLTTVIVALLFSLLSCASCIVSALEMSEIFGDHMVLQRAPLRAKLFGEATPHTDVSCTIDGGAALVVQADGRGRFVCELPPYALSWNRTVSVTGDKQTLTFTDVAFGDVVLCLGSATQLTLIPRHYSAPLSPVLS